MTTTLTYSRLGKILKENNFKDDYLTRLHKILDFAKFSAITSNVMVFFEMVVDDYEQFNAFTPVFTKVWKRPHSFREIYRSVMTALKVPAIKELWTDTARYEAVLQAHVDYSDTVVKQILIDEAKARQPPHECKMSMISQSQSQSQSGPVKVVVKATRQGKQKTSILTNKKETTYDDNYDDEQVDDTETEIDEEDDDACGLIVAKQFDEYHTISTAQQYGYGKKMIAEERLETLNRMHAYVANMRSMVELFEADLKIISKA